MPRNYRVTLGDALEAHEEALKLGGGLRGISSLDSIEGSLGRPYHGHHKRIWDKAAALLHGLAGSHGFNDANKRTAWIVTLLLIERSGYVLVLDEDDQIDQVAVDVVTGDMLQDQLVQWFRIRLAKLE